MSVRVVVYHDVSDCPSDFEAPLGVTTPTGRFLQQIDRLARDYDVIDAGTLISGRLPRRPLLITFDDHYRSVLDVARTVLAPRGLPAVLFTNPDLLGGDKLPLDAALGWVVSRHGMVALAAALGVSGEPTLAQLIFGPLAALAPSRRRELRDDLVRRFGIGPEALAGRRPSLKPADLRELVLLGVEIGNHTASHVSCRALWGEERRAEVVGAKEALEAITGQPVRTFSVPYGDPADLPPELLALLRASGHEATFLVQQRWNGRRPAPDVWFRTSLADEGPRALWSTLEARPLWRSLRHAVRQLGHGAEPEAGAMGEQSVVGAATRS